MFCIVFVWFSYKRRLQLTVGFAFLPWVAVVKDALGVVRPGQAAEFHPLQDIGQFAQVVSLDEMDGYPV